MLTAVLKRVAAKWCKNPIVIKFNINDVGRIKFLKKEIRVG
jgi:hypothetical protein